VQAKITNISSRGYTYKLCFSLPSKVIDNKQCCNPSRTLKRCCMVLFKHLFNIISDINFLLTEDVCGIAAEVFPGFSYDDTHHLSLDRGAKYSSMSFLQYVMGLFYKTILSKLYFHCCAPCNKCMKNAETHIWPVTLVIQILH
jgi:hypothetical protein